MSESAMLDCLETGFPETITPTPAETKLAKESSRSLAKLQGHNRTETVRVQVDGESEVVIPQSAFRLLMDILTEMSKGNAVTFIPIHAELTTQQAADILNVSRPFLVKQLADGAIPHRKVGSHRRVKFQDLIDYRRRIDQARAATLEELMDQAEELDMGY